jgi:regulator of protease activity HflC (stomatin/prohibitin superfamily)
MRPKLIHIAIATTVICIFAAWLLLDSFYTVQPNEVAGVTRFGSLVSAAPEGPGFHWKMPFADTAHHVRVSQDRFTIGSIKVKTVDNQFADVDISLTYHTGNPFKVLFQVGEVGPSGVEDKLGPFVKSRTLDVFGGVSALQIANEKKNLEASILTAIQPQALELFGEQIEDVQITKIEYSKQFEEAVETMVQTRNQQVAAQNLLQVRETEAKQAVAIAEGEANSAAARADGQKRVAIAQAEGEAQKVRLQADAEAYARKIKAEAEAKAIQTIGLAEADVIKTKVSSAGNPAAYADILRAEAAKNWTGDVSKVTLGNGAGGGQPVLVLPSSVLEDKK